MRHDTNLDPGIEAPQQTKKFLNKGKLEKVNKGSTFLYTLTEKAGKVELQRGLRQAGLCRCRGQTIHICLCTFGWMPI